MEDLVAKSILNSLDNELKIIDSEMHEVFFRLSSKITFVESDYADLSSNVIILISKVMKRNLSEVSRVIVPIIEKNENLESVSILNGFVNMYIKVKILVSSLTSLLKLKKDYCYGALLSPVNKNPLNIEYVSANPTGMLHLGHGRVAVFADAIASIMKLSGYNVTREYYINDAGGQVNLLAESVYMRYRAICGENVDLSSIVYPDEKLNDIARAIHSQHGKKFLNLNESGASGNGASGNVASVLSPDTLEFFRDFSTNYIMKCIKENLHRIGIFHDVFFSEKKLHDSNEVEEVVNLLMKKGYTAYEKMEDKFSSKGTESNEELLVFLATEFGDIQNRPLKKSNGDWTYFAVDIAYHFNKLQRGFSNMINVWGADHDNHVRTIKAAMSAVDSSISLEVITCQMLNLLESGKAVKMSKRAGNFVTIDEVVDKVGLNTFRFMMLTKKPDTHFDFDIESAVRESSDNPVFYVNYAYARANSVLNHVKDMKGVILKDLENTEGTENIESKDSIESLENIEFIEDPEIWIEALPEEINVLKMIRRCPLVFRDAANAKAPHRIINFLIDFAKAFHVLWNKGRENEDFRIISTSQVSSMRRVQICNGIMIVIESLLNAIGVNPQKQM